MPPLFFGVHSSSLSCPQQVLLIIIFLVSMFKATRSHFATSLKCSIGRSRSRSRSRSRAQLTVENVFEEGDHRASYANAPASASFESSKSGTVSGYQLVIIPLHFLNLSHRLMPMMRHRQRGWIAFSLFS